MWTVYYNNLSSQCFWTKEGIEDIVDDILCVGEGDTYESGVKDRDRTLIALLERCREKNFKLNPNKLQLVTESKKHPTLVMY